MHIMNAQEEEEEEEEEMDKGDGPTSALLSPIVLLSCPAFACRFMQHLRSYLTSKADWCAGQAFAHSATVLYFLPPPLSKHSQGQKNNSHTGSSCLDKPLLARNAQHKKTLHIENLPVPHTKHNSHKHGTRTRCAGKILHAYLRTQNVQLHEQLKLGGDQNRK